MKIGVFLAYSPATEFANQGLGRHLAMLVKAWAAHDDAEVILLTPSWSTDDVRTFLGSEGVATDRLTFLSPKGLPLALRVQRFVAGIRRDTRSRSRLIMVWRHVASGALGVCKRAAIDVAGWIMTARSPLVVVTAFVAGLAILPIVLVALFVGAALHLCTQGLRYAGRGLRSVLSIALPGGIRLERILAVLKNAREGRRERWARWALETVRRKELGIMVDCANDSNVDLWYCPTAFWPQFNQIRARRVVCIPDLTPSQFPVAFATNHPSTVDVVDECLRTIGSADHFITYSEIVAEEVASKTVGVGPERIHVVPHAPIDLLHHIDIRGTMDPQYARRRFANTLLEGHRNVHWQARQYLRDFSFTDVRYLFFPTQFRPNKNVLNLLVAYESVLRRKHRYVKLFLTGDISTDQQIESFICSKRLQYDVISFHAVPEQVLAALYHRADLVVNPSLFEGGFPFTFAEGLSVGTPSVQADIRGSRDFLGDELASEMLFDPYDPEAIARTIVHGLDNRERLLHKQLEVLRSFPHASWMSVAESHLRIFKQILAVPDVDEASEATERPRSALEAASSGTIRAERERAA